MICLRYTMIFLLMGTTMSAQINETVLYTIANGLPITESQHVAVDQEGYLWIISGSNHVTQYDGRQFQVMEPAVTGIDYLIHRDFVADAYGMWFTPINMGTKICRCQHSTWSCYPIDSLYFFKDYGQNRLVGYNSNGDIFHYLPQQDAWKKVATFPLPPGYKSHKFILKQVLFGTGYSLIHQTYASHPEYYYRSLTAGSAYHRIPTKITSEKPIVLRELSDSAPEPTKNQRLLFQTTKGSSRAYYKDPSGIKKELHKAWYSTISNGNYYVIANKNFDNNSSWYHIYRHEENMLFSQVATFRSGSPYLGFTTDKAGNFWITSHLGLMRINPTVLEFFDDQPNMISALHNINEDRHGNIWFGGYKTGLRVYDGVELKKGGPEYLKAIMPGSLRHPSGSMFFFDEMYGLVRYDGEIWHDSRSSVSDQKSMPFGTGYLVRELSGDRIGLGLNHKGLGILQDPEKLSDCILIGKNKGLELDNVITFTEDKNQRIWMGRSSQGMAVYDPKHDTVITWLSANYPELSSGPGCSHLDSQGNLWLGKLDGLYFVKDPHLIDIYHSSFLSTIKKISIQEAGEGMVSFLGQQGNYLIFGHAHGHGILDLPSFYENATQPMIYFFTSKGPNQGGASEQNAYFEDSKGNIWLGKDRGAIHLKLEDLFLDTLPVKIRIDSLYAADQRVNIDHSIIKLPVTKRNIHLWFHPGFTGLLNDNVTFQYKLTHHNLNKTITQFIQKENHLHFPYLPPGRNTLEIQALKNNQIADTIAVIIMVPKTLMENPWFWILSILLLSGIASLYLYNLSVQKVKFQQQELKLSEARREKEKLQIAAIANSLNPHFINNSLSWVQWALADDPKGISVVSRLAENIKTVFRKSREGLPFHSITDEFRLVENYLTIQQIRYGGYFEITLPAADTLAKWKSLQIPLMQIQIHVENAIEHGLRNDKGSNKLIIELIEEGLDLHIKIIDYGIGRPSAKQKKSSGTGEGTTMLTKMHAIYNKLNERPIRSWYEDTPFQHANGSTYGTIVHILLPKTYNYEFESD